MDRIIDFSYGYIWQNDTPTKNDETKPHVVEGSMESLFGQLRLRQVGLLCLESMASPPDGIAARSDM